MNNLKKYAGLLNEAAPKGEFLAYINEDESKMLKDAGASGLLTPQGIPSYRGAGAYQGGSGAAGSAESSSSGSSSSGSSSSGGGGGGQDMGSGGGNNNNNNNNGGSGSQFTSGGNISPGTDVKGNVRNDNPFTGDNSNDDIDASYTDTSFDVTPEPVEKNFFEKVIDFVKGGGVVGSVLRSIGGKLNPENQYEGITGEDGYGEGDYISTQGDWAASKGLVESPEKYYELDLEEQQAIDKQMYDDGVRSQAFNDLYNDGDTSNLNNLTTTERNEINKVIPNLPDAIGGTTPQESMVNKYFANMGSNLGVSSAYMDTYNAAKNKISQTLNLTPNNQQYGYGNTFNDNYARSMTSANPFFDELTNQGLI